MTGMDALKKEVLTPGLCVACGGCVGLCPHIHFYDGKVICTDACDLDNGRCYGVCPVAHGEEELSSKKEPVGPVIHIYRSRSTDKVFREKAQYGGTVTALIIIALDEGLIDEAVLTSDDQGDSPHGILAKTTKEVLACRGSRYTSSAALEAYNRRAQASPTKLGIVAMPCQAQSLALAIKNSENADRKMQGSELIIGLFCTWALTYRRFMSFLNKKDVIHGPLRYDIPPPPANIFQVFMDGNQHEFPLSDIREFIQAGCSLCSDLTAEYTDVSVGAMEGMEDWNTLIIRTNKGKQLVDRAVEKGVLELDELPEDNRNHLYEASLLKRQRGEENRKNR